jgi:hypothetical protein
MALRLAVNLQKVALPQVEIEILMIPHGYRGDWWEP